MWEGVEVLEVDWKMCAWICGAMDSHDKDKCIRADYKALTEAALAVCCCLSLSEEERASKNIHLDIHIEILNKELSKAERHFPEFFRQFEVGSGQETEGSKVRLGKLKLVPTANRPEPSM
jgi:hypothetical protein